MNEPTICHQGVVKEITGNMLYVAIERKTACSACHARNVCFAFDKKDEVITIPTYTPEIYQVGEHIQVSLQKSLGAKAVVIAYLCPFFALILGLFITYYFTKNELLSIGIAFVVTVLYFIFLKRMNNKINKHFTFEVNKIKE
jgi:sigma-E factor negative regulatory protein RseC